MQTVDNRKIAKNTIYLYIRMLLTLVVSLYTSRVVLHNLGVEDFGIYNVIGGVIVLFSFISIGLRDSSQRFISFELGKEENGNTNRVFCMSFQCILLIAIVVIIIGESIGLWFVNTKLNIPEGREFASKIVYQITILTFVINLLQIPLHATIIAYERMAFYSYMGIVDVLLKLGIAYVISNSAFDKLILYALLLLIVCVIGVILSAWYCFKIIGIGKLHFIKDRILFRGVMGYSGWSMLNGCAVISAQQGGNIILNIYNGVIANGAFGIANQVTSAIYSFVSNFQSAFQPQIVKQYAAGSFNEMHTLMNRASVYSYYLLLIIAVPFCVFSNYVLTLWLGNPPEYTSGFIMLMLLYFLVDAFEAPLWMLIGATGKMRVYTIWSASITILNIPLSLLLLSQGLSVYWVFIVRASLNIVCGIIRPLYLRSLVHSFSLKQWLLNTIRPLIVTILLGITVFLYFLSSIKIHPLWGIFITIIYTLLLMWLVGMKKKEKETIKLFVKSRIKNEH